MDPCWWWVLLGVGGEFPAHPKVDLSQLVVPWIAGPHCCKYLPDGTNLLFHGALLDWYTSGCHKSDAHSLCEDLEKGEGIADALEVGWDSYPFT